MFTIINKKGKRKAVKKIKGYIHLYTAFVRTLIYAREEKCAQTKNGRKKMWEKTIEKKLVDGVKNLGGKAYKFVSPGNVGVPDRIVVWPNGKIDFVELKTEAGVLSKVQKLQIRALEARRCEVRVLYGAAAVKEYLRHGAANYGL